MPNLAPDGPLPRENKGVLSPVGDIVGQVLDKALMPLGHVVGKIGNPTGEALWDVRHQAKEEVGYSGEIEKVADNRPDEQKAGGKRIGGNTQTGENPLGL